MTYFYSKNYVSLGNEAIWWLLAGTEPAHGLFGAEQKTRQLAPRGVTARMVLQGQEGQTFWRRDVPGCAAAASCPCKAQGRER